MLKQFTDQSPHGMRHLKDACFPSSGGEIISVRLDYNAEREIDIYFGSMKGKFTVSGGAYFWGNRTKEELLEIEELKAFNTVSGTRSKVKGER